MKKKYIQYICGTAIISLLGLYACTDEKEFGNTGEEAFLINSIQLEKTGYEIKTGAICLVYGQKLKLNCQVGPENADNLDIMWTSSQKNIATIDKDGVITAGNEEGSTTIYAMPAIGFGASETTPSCIVKVIREAVPVTGLTLKSDNPEDETNDFNVLAGEFRQLKVTVSPEDHTYERFTWTTSNPQVATVTEKGLVEMVAPGEVTITLTSDEVGGAASASMSFKVAPSVQPTGIEFINTEKLLNMAYGESVNLKDFVKLTPEDATFSLIKWTSTNDKLLSVDNLGNMKVNFDIVTANLKMIGHSLTLTGSTQTGTVLGSTEVKTEGGHFIHNFRDGLAPFTFDKKQGMSYQEHDTYMHVNLGVQSATDSRQDLKLAETGNNGGYMLSTTKYKYFAMKFRRPYYYDDATGKYSRYAPGKNGNKLAFNITPLTGSNVGHWESFKQLDITNGKLIDEQWDGQPKVYVWTLDGHNNLKNATDPETGLVDIKNADLVIADVKAEQEKSYDIYWIGTFSSLEEIKAYYEANE